MDSTNDDRQETNELAARFMRVFEASFKQMSQRRHFNHFFKDLSINKLHMLNMLYHHHDTMKKELADLLEITPAADTTAVREGESMGLIDQRAYEHEARLIS